MNEAKKHTQPTKTERPVSTARTEPAIPVATITAVYTEEVHERAEMITPFLAEILQKSVSTHWGINE